MNASTTSTSVSVSGSSTKTATSVAVSTAGVEKLGGGGVVGYLAAAGAAGLWAVAVLL